MGDAAALRDLQLELVDVDQLLAGAGLAGQARRHRRRPPRALQREICVDLVGHAPRRDRALRRRQAAALRDLQLELVDVDQLLAGAGLAGQARRHRRRPPRALQREISVDLVVDMHRAAIARAGAGLARRKKKAPKAPW